MKIYSRAIAIAMVLLTVVFGAFVAFSNSKTASALRNGIQMSIEEDFKIKDSLGKIFFVDAQEESQAVSGNATVVSYFLPMDAVWEKNGEQIEFYPQNYQGVVAVKDGFIEEITDESVIIRHEDGSISKYLSCKPLCKENEQVSGGQTIGYASEKMVFCHFKDGKTVDLSGYFK